MTPALFEKSWSRPSRSSCSSDAERYAADATALEPFARLMTLALKW